MENEHVRLPYLDAARFLAMTLVCCYHFPLSGLPEFGWDVGFAAVLKGALLTLRCMAIPLFFMTSGALQLAVPFQSRTWLGRILAMGLQYLVWRGLIIAALMAIQGVSFAEIGAGGLVRGVLYASVPGLDLSLLWFIPALLSLRLFQPLLQSAVFQSGKGPCWGWVLAAALLVGNCLEGDARCLGESVPFLRGMDVTGIALYIPFSNRACMAVLYYLLGGLMQAGRDKIRSISPWIIGLAGLAGWGMVYVQWNLSALSTGAMYDHMLMYYTSGCALLTLSVFALLMRLLTSKTPKGLRNFLAFAGGNTLGVYYLHWPLGSALYAYAVSALPLGLGTDLMKGLILTLGLSAVTSVLSRVPVVRKLFLRAG